MCAATDTPFRANASSDDLFIYSNITAGAYTTYDVIKTNSNGRRQARVMGIDQDHIYNLMPNEEKTQTKGRGVLPSRTVKRALRNMDEVETVEVDAAGPPGAFRVVFREGTKLNIYQFEALDPRTAREIVAKIKYLSDKAKEDEANALADGAQPKGLLPGGSESSRESSRKGGRGVKGLTGRLRRQMSSAAKDKA